MAHGLADPHSEKFLARLYAPRASGRAAPKQVHVAVVGTRLVEAVIRTQPGSGPSPPEPLAGEWRWTHSGRDF